VTTPLARPAGLLAAILTPLAPALAPDHERFLAHARWLLQNGCDGLNVLGTTGEAASFSVAQRLALMRAVAASDLPLEKLLVGTGASALADSVALTTAATELRFGGTLVIPPFYYKDVPDTGVFDYYRELIGRSDSKTLRLYLYNFPKMSGVAFSLELIERLLRAFPATIVGLKDSSGDFEYAAAVQRAFPGFAVFPSSEATLVSGRRSGFAGCISATLNVTAPYCASLLHEPPSAAEGRQAEVAAMRAAIAAFPLIAALRFLVSDLHGDPAWLQAMPPLDALPEAERALLAERLARAGYARGAGAFA